MATIKDVAKEAGVSVTTVSRILNNRGYISKETRKKVYDAMDALNYRPNEVARSLFKKKSNILGLIIPDVGFSFYGEFTRHFEETAHKKGYKVLLCNSSNDSEKEKEYIKMLKSNQVDGIIMGSHSLDIKEYLDLNLPVVALDRILSPKIPCITSDNYLGGYKATSKLIENGCKKIAHISGSLKLNTPANRRTDAFIDLVKKKEIDYILIETELNKFSFTKYLEIIEKLLLEHKDIDGIFASNDIVGMAAIRIAHKLNIDIPNKLQIIGFDGVDISYLSTPQLTTIRQQIDVMAEESINTIIRLIEGNILDEYEKVIPIKFIEGETTK